MASLNDEDTQNEESYEDEVNELYGVRDGIIFVIDATPRMFKKDPEKGIPYFLQCIRQYKEILKQKLVWNRKDWMGLTFFGTEKWDPDSETKYILTFQKLSPISMDGLKEVIKIDEGKKWEHYGNIACHTAYPLHDALWHAARAFCAVNISMTLKTVILFTCQDNPPMTNDDEKHRIRVTTTSYNDIGLQLFVVGMGNNFNHELFYKDLEMLSQQIDAEDYKRTSLKDLVEQVKLPSRNMAKLPWRLGENVTIDILLRNLSVKSTYLRKENISKETNTALVTCTYLKTVDDNEENIIRDENQRISSPVLEMDIQKYQTFGGKNIYFTLAEVRSLCAVREPGIDLICMKPISYHPLYHNETPYFVIPNKSNRKDNKLLFGALLNKCEVRNLMIICAVTIRKRSAPRLYTMLPNAKNGGFYLYKIPFRENVRRYGNYLSDFIYGNHERKPPIDRIGVELLENIIKKLSIGYDPNLFSNPKLQVQLQTVETLALDLEKRDSPPDDTLPKVEEMNRLAKDLLDEYDNVFHEKANVNDISIQKKRKGDIQTVDALEDEGTIRNLVKTGQINTYTVSQLKIMSKALCLKISGKKEDLINRIKDYYKTQ